MTRRGGPSHKWLPPHFMLFIAAMAVCGGTWLWAWPDNPAGAMVVGFDFGATCFMASLVPLLRDNTSDDLRRHASENDANRGTVLIMTTLVTLAILAAIRHELPAARNGDTAAVLLLIATLALAWTFTNLVFMLHYAHMHYALRHDSTGISGGFEFPGTPDPDYWDFVYFAFTAGMSFAASDVNVTCAKVRRVLVLHSLLSFVFNIGVLAFSINVLAGGG